MDLLIYEVKQHEDTFCSKMMGADWVQRYRGTFSNMPTASSFPEGCILFTEFMNALSGPAEFRAYNNLQDVTRLYNLLSEYDPERQYEIVEHTHNGESPKVGSRLIGYDVSIVYNLSLVWIALISYSPDVGQASSAIECSVMEERLQPILELFTTHFCRKLNADGLFSTFSDADLFLRCARTLNSLEPNLWESPKLMKEFAVTALYEVRDPDAVQIDCSI